MCKYEQYSKYQVIVRELIKLSKIIIIIIPIIAKLISFTFTLNYKLNIYVSDSVIIIKYECLFTISLSNTYNSFKNTFS